MKNSNFRSTRRGVTLLLVLALMSMFAMLIVTFMIVTTNARGRAENKARNPGAFRPTPMVEQAIVPLLIGGYDADKGVFTSTIGPHGILENLYGHPYWGSNPTQATRSLRGTVPTTPTVRLVGDQNQLQLLQVRLNFTSNSADYQMAGNVFTITGFSDTPTANQEKLLNKSTLIVDAGTGGDFLLLPFSGNDVPATNLQANLIGACSFIINTPAHSGTGMGFDRSVAAGSPALTKADDDGVPYALRPNPLAPSTTNQQDYVDYLHNTDNFTLMNPDYTAPDAMNMFLAWYDVNEQTSGLRDYKIDKIIPSFHRPELVKYYNSTDPRLLRKIVLRPLPDDHPDFTGSNPAMTLSNYVNALKAGPWDVDNDNDGIADSVWINAGLGVVKDPASGKTYIRLASYLVLDMDGRLNVNVHGNASQWETPPTMKGGFGSLNKQGVGAGPAEIRLDHYVGNANNLRRLFMGQSETLGRYGDTVNGGYPGHPNAYPNDQALISSELLWGQLGVPYFGFAYPGDSSIKGGRVPDLWGYSHLLFDPLGNRYSDQTQGFYTRNPYLADPYSKGGDDEMFTPEELQMLLRSPGDMDFTNLLPRLRFLLNDQSNEDKAYVDKWSENRFYLTTRSSEIPVANRSGGADSGGSYRGLYDRIESFFNSTEAYKARDLWFLLPEEIRRGEKVDLNRIAWIDASSLTAERKLRAKMKFAQEMYYLLLVLCHDQIFGSGSTYGSSVENMSQEEMLTRLAQWSVNLVDFLDTDGAMTPFLYGTDPFQVKIDRPETGKVYDFNDDFNSFITSGTFPSRDDVRLVWGMEKSEVALTKTFATHTRRVADSRHDSKPGISEGVEGVHKKNANPQLGECKNGCDKYFRRIKDTGVCTCTDTTHIHDKKLDQVMIPQGSLFLELHRLGNPNTYSGLAQSKSVNGVETPVLNLAQMDNNNTGSNPVWRIAIGKAAKTKPGTTPDVGTNDVFHETTTDSKAKAKSYTFQPPQKANDPISGNCTVSLERYIYFCRPSGSRTDAYYNFGSPSRTMGSFTLTDMSNVELAPNDYLVIGPRLFTSFKSKPVDDDPREAGDDPISGDHSDHFGTPDLSAGTYIDLEEIRTDAATQGFREPKIMVAAAPIGGQMSSDWNNSDSGDIQNIVFLGQRLFNNGRGIGVSVSEPLVDTGYYPAPRGAASPEMAARMGKAFSDSYIVNEDDNTANVNCKDASFCEKLNETKGNGTISLYRSAFLQRLADPSRAYNAISNPYITVDWNMIDLHVFNTESDANGLGTIKDEEENLVFNENAGLYFGPREWGVSAKLSTSTGKPNRWDRCFDSAAATQQNGGLTKAGSSDPDLGADFYMGRYARTSSDVTDGSDYGTLYQGAPKDGFVHFPWFDSPLLNTFELMMVPACNASRFGYEFHDAGALTSQWDNSTSLGKTSMRFQNPDTNRGPYFNFLKATSSSNDSLDLYQLFDYVRVPSKFNGSIHGWYVPSGSTDTPPRPIYKMREPGKINLNTATEPVWDALTKDVQGAMKYVEDDGSGLKKMREDTSSSGNQPVQFGTPFRSPSSVHMVPLASMMDRDPVDATVLGSTGPSGSKVRLVAPDTSASRENPYTGLENVMRLADVTTCRSNVFAVWVTVGYFEVDQFISDPSGTPTAYNKFRSQYGTGVLTHVDGNNFDAIYPDGCIIGAEKGLGDGSVRRHRGFFLIDRTVPVGFRRGEELNAKDVIIYKKILE